MQAIDASQHIWRGVVRANSANRESRNSKEIYMDDDLFAELPGTLQFPKMVEPSAQSSATFRFIGSPVQEPVPARIPTTPLAELKARALRVREALAASLPNH